MINVHVYLHGNDDGAIKRIVEGIQVLMANLQTLIDQVAAEHTVIASAIALLNGIKQQLDAALAAQDPAALQALADSIGADTQALAAAVQANTAPVAGEPEALAAEPQP